ncbi:hypothetical protein F5Y06DRAFT_44469 [Hypoxylon sp. FL0890]|nr:hypothetical protein F5Y06DRAFT_44469 [Hypoxylon sp. FL0890]
MKVGLFALYICCYVCHSANAASSRFNTGIINSTEAIHGPGSPESIQTIFRVFPRRGIGQGCGPSAWQTATEIARSNM